MKKLLTALSIVSLLIAPAISQASFLGLATNADVTTLQNEITQIQSRIDVLKSELETATPAEAASSTMRFGAAIPVVISNYTDSLASKIGTTDTSMTLVNGADSTGRSLSGYVCFAIDNNSASLEYVCGNASGTTVSNLIRGIDPIQGTVTVSALEQVHRRGAPVQVTDYPILGLIGRIFNGQESIPTSTNGLYMAGHSPCSAAASTSLVDFTCVSGVATSGAPDAGIGAKGLVAITTPGGAATSTDGSSVLYNLISKQYFASASQGATTTVVMTTASGTIDKSFIASSTNYQLNSQTLSITTATSSATSTDSFNLLPAGVIQMYATTTAPAGWLACDGTQYATSSYPRLFTVIGYTYGGSTSTFAVPNMKGNFVAGTGGQFGNIGATGGAATSSVSGSITTSNIGATGGPAGFAGAGTYALNNGLATTTPPYIIEQFIIKY